MAKFLLEKIERREDREGGWRIFATPSYWVSLLLSWEVEGLPSPLSSPLLPTSSPSPSPLIDSLFLSGEGLSFSLFSVLDRLSHPLTLLVNLYGSSECSANVSFHVCARGVENSGEVVPTGKPLSPHTRLFILSPKTLLPLPPGVAGDVYVSGLSLCSGVVGVVGIGGVGGDDKSHAPSPLVYLPEWVGTEEGRVIGLKTGDIGWVDEKSGELVVLGRGDRVVKVRGQRVSLEEMESAVIKCCANQSRGLCVVAGVENEGVLLCGVFSSLFAEEDENGEKNHLLVEELALILPSFMIPELVFFSPSLIPRLPTGKVNRRKITQMVIETFKKGHTNVSEHKEQPSQLLQPSHYPILSSLLCFLQDHLSISLPPLPPPSSPLPPIFSSTRLGRLGVHSLSGMRLGALIKQKYQIRIPVGEIMKMGSLVELSKRIEEELRGEPILQSSRLPSQSISSSSSPSPSSSSPSPLSSSLPSLPLSWEVSLGQRQLWFEHQKTSKTSPSLYNIHFCVDYEGDFEVRALEKAWERVVERHTALKMEFLWVEEEEGGRLMGRVNEQCSLSTSIEVSSCEASVLSSKLSSFVSRPFNLSQAPLARLLMVRVESEPKKWTFGVVVHHIVSDEWSMSLLLSDLKTTYSQFCSSSTSDTPASLPSSSCLPSYALHELSTAKKPSSLSFWKDFLSNLSPLPLPLPFDFPRSSSSFSPSSSPEQGAEHRLTLSSPSLISSLETLCDSYSTSPFLLLLSIWLSFLSRISGEDDIIVGIPVTTRSTPTEMETIGYFVNTIPLRMSFDIEKSSLNDILLRLGGIWRRIEEHKGVPLPSIMEVAGGWNRDANVHPLFQTMFVWQEGTKMEGGEKKTEEGWGEEYQVESGVSKFDLSFLGFLSPKTLDLSLEYRSSLFSSKTISSLLSSFSVFLSHWVKNPFLSLSSVNLVEKSHTYQPLLHPSPPLQQPQDPLAFPNTTALQVFYDNCKKYPHKTAVVFQPSSSLGILGVSTSITYSALFHQALSLSQFMKEKLPPSPKLTSSSSSTTAPTCPPMIIIGPQTPLFILSQLAVLLSHSFFIPLSHTTPLARIQSIITTSSPRCVVVMGGKEGGWGSSIGVGGREREELGVPVVGVEEGEGKELLFSCFEGSSSSLVSSPFTSSFDPLDSSLTGMDTMYSIFTSGTTG